MGCALLIVGALSVLVAADSAEVPAVRWVALGLLAFVVLLGVIRELLKEEGP